MSRIVFRSLTMFALVFVIAGCGDGHGQLVPVSGRVLIDGKPLSYGVVRFIPENARPSGGKLNENGEFKLTCYEEGDGAAIGEHKVEISAGETLSATQVRWHAPKKYTSFGMSGLTQKIEGPTDSLVINITWDKGAPYVENVGSEVSQLGTR